MSLNLLVLLLGLGAAQAGKPDAIERALESGDAEGARKKCERWEAAAPSTEQALREQCARAFWGLASEEDSVVAWATFRATWKGTNQARRAVDREAEAALRTLPMKASEADLLAVAEAYPDTIAGDEARLAAMDAAVRDADSDERAVEVARRYPGHPGLPKLVSRHPTGFFTVQVQDREVTWKMEPEVELPAELSPRVRWVAVDGDEVVGDWDRTVRGELTAAGLRAATVDGLRPRDGRALPLCLVPGKPWKPAAALSVGQGLVVSPADYDEGCGPDAWPVFVSVEGRRVRSISLEPGHRIDLGAQPGTSSPASSMPSSSGLSGSGLDLEGASAPLLGEGESLASGIAGVGTGAALIADGIIYERAQRGWLVHAVSGGAPWLNALGAPDDATPLDSSLRGPAIPRGWRVAREAGGNRIFSSMVGGDQPPWRLGPGEVRILAPLTQAVLGLRRTDAVPKGPRAPVLAASVPFSRDPQGLVEPRPPMGGAMAGLYAVEPNELSDMSSQLAGVGLDDVKILDAWRADLDGDKVPETLLRADRAGEGLAIVLDPYKKGAPRVFPFRCPKVRMAGKTAPTPFAFRYQEHVYLAWSGMSQTGSAGWDSWVMAVRADGDSYALDAVHQQLGP